MAHRPIDEPVRPHRIAELARSIAARRATLNELRPLHRDALVRLERYYDAELTYTSNALEGNALSPAETTLVIEKGVTIAGKPLRDHMEALDHHDAIGFVRELARSDAPLTQSDIRNLHALVLRRSQPDSAGRYADLARYVRTDAGRHDFPSPAEVPARMGDFAAWLRDAPATPATAFDAHRRLVEIHPFNDGNGRTARLLMNLILLRGGYPPAVVRLEDRLAYLRALREAQSGLGAGAFDLLMHERLDAALEDYVRTLSGHVRAAGS